MPAPMSKQQVMDLIDTRFNGDVMAFSLKVTGDMAAMTHETDPELIGVTGRAMLIAEDLWEEYLGRKYTTQHACPYCGMEPRTAGGQHSRTYCPSCHAYVINAQWHKGQCYLLWSTPERKQPA